MLVQEKMNFFSCAVKLHNLKSFPTISLAYGYSSMADTDWGWKKRSDEDEEDNSSLNEVSALYNFSSSLMLVQNKLERFVLGQFCIV